LSIDVLARAWGRVMGTDKKQFDKFFEQMMDGFSYHKIIVDKTGKPTDYVFIEVNNAFETLTGLKRENIIGKKVTEVLKGIENDPADWIGVYGKVALTGEPAEFENFAESLGKWYRISAYCPEKGYFVTLFEDITQRKKAEEKSVYLASFPELNPNPIIEIDFNCAVQYANPAARKILSGASDLSCHPFLADLEQVKTALQNRENPSISREVKVGESTFYQTLSISPDGKRIRFYAVNIDARKQAENDLKENEKLWSTTVSSIGDAVITTDLNGKITFLNNAAERITGWSLDEASGKSLEEVFKIINEQTRSRDENPVDKVLKEGNIVGLANHTLLMTKDGQEVPIDDSGAPIRNKEGDTTGVVLVFRDIAQRRKAEAQIALQAFMIANANDAIIGYTLDQKVSFWNKSAEQLYGFRSEEALGKTGVELLQPGYSSVAREDLVRQLSNTGHIETESARKTKDGRSVVVEAHVILLRNDAGKPMGYVSVDRDISERRKMEAALRKANEELEEKVQKQTSEVSKERQRLYNVLETLPAYVVLLDEDYCVPFANRVFKERFGESHGKRCYDFLFNRNSPCENCETYKVMKTNGPHRWEWTGPDGRDYDIYDFPFTEDDGSKLILEMGIDITERKLAEKQVRSASLYSRSLIEASLDPLVTISAEGKITDVNKATERVTGFDREHLVGSDFCDYFTSPEEARKGYLRVFSEGFVKDYPLSIRSKEGEITDVLYNATVYRNEAGQIQGIFAAARDVTEKKRVEAELEKYREHLEQLVSERTLELRKSEHLAKKAEEASRRRAEDLEVMQGKLEEKATEVEEYATRMEELAEERALRLKDAERFATIGQTAGMVGHDIRNPLQSIISELYLAKAELPSITKKEVRKNLSEGIVNIENDINYINKIVADLQDFAKPLKPALKEIDLESLFNESLSKINVPKNIEAKCKISDDAKQITSDATLLKRVVDNLITNAVQAMPDGGKLTVRASCEAGDVVIVVEDTGNGIPEEAKSKLFTPLFTTKSKGQGFGLAVVKRMTEALGGKVTFESETGKGTIFMLHLPQNGGV
jgi:PAS domain S-box-containing protein